MKKFVFGLFACCHLTACASMQLETLSSDNQDIVFNSNNDTADFETFLDKIRQDEIKIAHGANKFNVAESAFGIGVIAAAAYGGYTTVFGDGDNLKDAAFAAASITTLRDFVAPAARRDASRQASRRLDCLIREATPFRGEFYSGVQVVSQSLTSVQIQRGGGRSITKSTLNSGWSTRASLFRSAGLNRSQRAAVSRFEANVENTASAEKKIFDDRFRIVLGAYRKIILNWEAQADKEFPTYDDTINAFKTAVEETGEQEEQQDENAEQARSLMGFANNPATIDSLLQIGTRYTEAKAEILKCTVLD